MKQFPLNPHIQAALSLSKNPPYIVGGYIRNHILGRKAEDLDLACPDPPGPYAKELARRLHGRLVVLDDRTQVYRVVLDREKYGVSQVDMAKLQGKNIEQDLARRDFTINALALSLNDARGSGFRVRGFKKSEILDPFGGMEDLKKGLVRLVSPEAFPEDPLRLLRVFRIAAELEMEIDPRALQEVRRHAAKIRKPAPERIQSELNKILQTPQSSLWLERMDQTGLLTSLLPELEPSRRCAAVYYGRGGVLKHSLTAVGRIEHLLQNLKTVFPRLHPAIQSHLSAAGIPNSLLKLTVLLHDVAKPKTARRIKGRLRFFGHEEQGGKMAEAILKRLRYSRSHVHLMSTAIRHHLRPGNLAANPIVSDKAVFRFYRDLGPAGVPLLLVCWADHASYLTPTQLKKIEPHIHKNPNTPITGNRKSAIYNRQSTIANPHKTLRHLQVVGHLLRCYFQEKRVTAPPKLIDGNDVMKNLHWKPGPQIGEALERVQEAQAEGKVKTRREALLLIRRLHRHRAEAFSPNDSVRHPGDP